MIHCPALAIYSENFDSVSAAKKTDLQLRGDAGAPPRDVQVARAFGFCHRLAVGVSSQGEVRGEGELGPETGRAGERHHLRDQRPGGAEATLFARRGPVQKNGGAGAAGTTTGNGVPSR